MTPHQSIRNALHASLRVEEELRFALGKSTRLEQVAILPLLEQAVKLKQGLVELMAALEEN